MRTIRFHKMHGAGNDYIYVYDRNQIIDNPQQLSIKISNRHFGVGSDGLVLILPSDKADFKMRIFNSDGSEAEMCGNASRCVGKYVYELGLTINDSISLETLSGLKNLTLDIGSNNTVRNICVDMGIPSLLPESIPVNYHNNTGIPVTVNGITHVLTCVSMGNPHAVIFTGDTYKCDVAETGSAIENNLSLFPEKCNVEFVRIINRKLIEMRVWERGSGETLACGTGACAALVAAVSNGLCDRSAKIKLLGGSVDVAWDCETGKVYLNGGAEWVFSGEYKY